MITVVSTSWTLFSSLEDANRQATRLLQGSESKDSLKVDVTLLKEDVDQLKRAVFQSAPLPSDQQLALKIDDLKQQMNSLDQRLGKLETAIMASPAKALEIPLLQRDLDSVKASQLTHQAAMAASVDRIYDQNKWLLGGMAVSIIVLAITSLARGREASN
ncbi:hypothetical protein [Pseudomonas knackmussii]|uniref:hypothetical protein n=1 Tax=Pseudomonas knackmussii TaxID=65741 RepID=UPI0005B9529B|nr:hypothetical protein [Pseudomonas knackmussii]